MQKPGGAVILMQKNLTRFKNLDLDFVCGDSNILENITGIPVCKPFNNEVIEFLNDVSKILLSVPDAKKYPDIITFAFWIRKSSMTGLKQKFFLEDSTYIYMGKGVVFHIAPSNVPVNYAYSLVTGLVCGNINIVRLPSKKFPQTDIINSAIIQALEKHTNIKQYIILTRYGHDQDINNLFSYIADARVIWGGDNTINELRKCPVKPYATEIVFPDRYSAVVIDSSSYLEIKDKETIARDFYNDTFLTDQNACTSPRIVIWTGSKVEEAQYKFWEELYNFTENRYVIQDIQSVNKLTSMCKAAVYTNSKLTGYRDNLIIRISVDKADSGLMELKDNSGYFYEYICNDIMELWDLCNNNKCQTLSYIGNKGMFIPLLQKGVKGISHIVPVGKTMDFNFIWDGYNLVEELTRKISFKG